MNFELFLISSLILDEKRSQSVELAGKAMLFIMQLFKQHSANGLLNYSGILEIFEPINSKIIELSLKSQLELPWPNIDRIVKTEIYNEEICIDMQSWISLWK